ncbi:holo-ACP synthase [Candidatus Berkiella cookevillensis]|uniref:Holo-[acyl-carrier-protein] synthase n=1 Tax=Candidatus Berkiella cookevillensis TaxID=437022 RepID=A0A0Q9YK48_9GAMM|nr:holo-ACP synthase [Candidatus Berkiella cookevillensis]MCS5708285.1 holo-ACP synthase [Candidatus Berkiella cookevillensis]
MLNIFGIGTDIVSVPRIQKNIDNNKNKFIDRILSDKEKMHLPSEVQLVGYIAKRFAAKEAFAKALGTGIADGLAFNQISVLNNASGQPYIECEGKALAFVQAHNIQSIQVSLSDEQEYALAFVVLVCASANTPIL